ncbi:High-affinity fructose transporter ght6 [Penicillium atrosanguineum]|uniref:High-affinity fructose transporter ght6 n=1 Tax=Penicillium atrosanguineum TaxID=1132637 RepID=UPI0023A74DF7|nr:High-affinity fructose transporter ght6 [Penicillium atrosanguineum]KAJ5314381.1 High-affinity fructose transporter ght6 [Penicillium atrosanguineum]
MDLQGTPLPHGARSTKVTTDPLASQQPNEESAGPVASDSLAAQSVREGGAFSENRGAKPIGVSGSKSTLNNTDTSSATKLPSAPVGGLRDDRERQEKYPEALGGQGNFPGVHLSQSGYVGGPTSSKEQKGMHAGQQSTASGSGPSHVAGQAPSYINDVTDGYKHSKPDGRNIHEGGFSSDDKNASFTTEIGSDQDPARAAINKFQRTNAESGPDAGRARQKGVEDQHPFQTLDEQRI